MPPEGGVPPGAARLRVGEPAPYVYRLGLKRAAAAALDRIGDLCLAAPPPPVDWTQVRRVAVLRLDHLGDLCHCLEALRRLRLALPQAHIDLWVGPWGRELAELFVDVDAVQVTQAPWFERPRRAGSWRGIASLARGLRLGSYDAAFDLRGDLRHALALWACGIAVRVGQTLTAGRFLLSHPVRRVPGLHETDQNLALLDQVGVPARSQGRSSYLRIPEAARRRARVLCRSLKLGASPVLAQAACGTLAKRWTQESWAAVLEGLPAGLPVALLGSAEEAGEMRALAAKTRRPVAVLAGRLDVAALAALLGRARLLLSVDSGPAHLAAVQGTPVLTLFSGANAAARWAPRGRRVAHLQAEGFPCSPCELAVCPYDNACMRALEPAGVLAQARRLLKARPSSLERTREGKP